MIRGARVPHALLLSNGMLGTLVSDAGGGYAAFGRLALTRWNGDATRDAEGHWLYVRDAARGTLWSAGAQPVRRDPDRYETRFRPGVVEIVREDDGIETRTEIGIAPDASAEIRRYTFINLGSSARRLELTTFLELALNGFAADAGHPAFSRLFVQTAHRAGDVLVAWRRPRSPGDDPLWVAHTLVVAGGGGAEVETDRARFLGRGRDPSDPVALAPGAALSGTVGNVLDPIFSIRRILDMPPGATRVAIAVSAAAGSEKDLAEALRLASDERAAVALEAAAARGAQVVAELSGALEWPAVPAAIGAAAYAGEPIGLTDNTRVDDRALLAALAGSRIGDRAVELYSGSVPRPMGSLPRVAALERPAPGGESLLFFNGHGGFTADGGEYVILVDPASAEPRPPAPWTNVVANETLGFIASESGASFTWSVNSRENRLTPWFNDPVTDPHGEALYLRDEETGHLWSPMPGPSAGAPIEIRHGMGYSRWRGTSDELDHDVWMFVPRNDPVRIARVVVTNRAERPRRLAAASYAQLVLGGHPQDHGRTIRTSADRASDSVFAVNPVRGEFSSRVTFAAARGPAGSATTFTTDRAAFLGRLGSAASPAALSVSAPLDGRTGAFRDACAAHRIVFTLPPGGTAECLFLLGEADGEESARAILARCASPGEAGRALDEARGFWRELVDGLQITTPVPALDLMVNRWLPYQNLGCRMWARSAFYQSGGAFGFRDQLQDAAALMYLDPAITRRQLLRHAAHQFIEGDVLHWWHPPLSKGIRTRFADDLLWLPHLTTTYVDATGDDGVLDEDVRFVRGRALDPGDDERFLIPEDAGESATLYEHCCRALDRSLTRGAHGLPLIGVGDWNDGMNRVGREGRGESVWLGFFLARILLDVIPVCRRRGDDARASRYAEYRAALVRALNADDAGWDGAWYRRAYYDDGTPIGSASSDECRIDAIAQAWSVISRVASKQRAAQALDAMERHLVSEREGIIRLLTPAFDATPHDPGYIKGYLPGVRENGGQYTHGALWAVRALAEAGRGERAARLLEMLSPVSHGATPRGVATYRAEPYVIAADVYGVAPHIGRAGWTWYTGSAGWMFRVAIESILGFTLDRGEAIVLRPAVPASWPGFTIRYRPGPRSATYEIRVTRAASGTATLVSGIDGSVVADGAVRIPLRRDHSSVRIDIVLGDDVGPRYEPADA